VECASGVIDTLETYVDVELLTDEEECRADFLIEQNRCRFQFFDISQGDPVEWQWDFGDSFAGEGADTSTAQNPAYGYLYSSDNAPGGSYQVTLTIRCRDGNESSISKDVQCEKGNQSINCSWDAPSSCNQWNKSSNPDYAYVLFLTDPPGATIFIDGYSNPCTTPAVVELWEQGSLKILVRKNDECDCEDLFDIINVVHGGVYCREYTLRCRGGPHVEQESQQVTDLQGTMTTDPQGNLYVIDYGNGTVILIGPDGTATTYASGIDRPMSPIFDDKGNLYVGSFNGNIYKISPTGEKIVVASNIWSPQGMDLDHNGNLYVACGYDGNIYKIFPDGAITSTFSGFAHPKHLAVYADGNIYVVDSGGTLIVRITPEGEKASLVDLGETILGMATDGEYLYVSHSDKISRIDTSGQVTHIATDLDQPSSLTVCNGSVFVTVSDGIVKLKISKQTVCASAKISITSGSEFKRANFTIGGTEPQKVSITSHADNFAIMAIPDMRIVYRVTDGSKSSGSLTLAPGTYILSCSGGGVAYLESATVCIEYPVVTGTPLAPTP
jgi:PKD repeat protein